MGSHDPSYTIIKFTNTNDNFNYYFTYNDNRGITLHTEPSGVLIITRSSASSLYSDSYIVFYTKQRAEGYKMDIRKDRRPIELTFWVTNYHFTGNKAIISRCQLSNPENQNDNLSNCTNATITII